MVRTLSAALLAVSVLAAPAGAAVVTYTSSTDWAAATQSPVSYGFGAFSGVEAVSMASYSAGPFAFTGSSLWVYDDATYGAPYLEADNGMDVAIGDGLRALSFNVGSWGGNASVQVTINGIVAATFQTLSNTPFFFGVTADEAITSVSFAATATGGPGGAGGPLVPFDEVPPGEPGPGFPPFFQTVLFDVISFQSAQLADEQPAPVPEPAMLGLFGFGALGLALSRRRRA